MQLTFERVAFMSGMMMSGQWQETIDPIKITDGKFMREAAQFRNWVQDDPTASFPAEANRYHLYVSLACPFASRCIIMRKLKSLEQVISMSIAEPLMLQGGWRFSKTNLAYSDQTNYKDFLHEIYLLADTNYSGRVTVPILWDKKTKTIVNNESADIMRMLNSAFHAFANNEIDYYPEKLRQEIDEMNEIIYHNINNSVYQCGFATSQSAYENAFDRLFNTLDELEGYFNHHTYLVGDEITEADWRFFTTLIRFDHVYYGLFKCNKRRILEYPNIFSYICDLYQVPGIAATIDFDQIKTHYYGSLKMLNPNGIIPKGPEIHYRA